MSNLDERRNKMIEKVVENEVMKRGMESSVGMGAKDKEEIIAAVTASLKKPEKKKNEEGRAVQSVGSDKIFYGEFDGSFRRMYTEDDKLFFFDEFCKHHKLTNDPTCRIAYH